MADAIPDNGLFNDLLQKLIGSSTNTKTNEGLDVENLIKQLTTGTTSQNTTGSTQQNTNQTVNQVGTQTTNQNVGTTGTQTQNTQQTGTNTSTQSVQANIDALKQVFAQQQAGITPDALKAIFTEGAKAVPGLTAATANAVGARSGSNSALATALTDLNTNLTSQAATQSQAMRNASSTTAAQIADLTKQLTTTGTNSTGTTGTLGTTQNQITNGVTGTNQNTGTTGTVGTTQNASQTGTNSQSVDTNQSQKSDKYTDTDQASTINAKSSGLTLGAAGLGSLLSGATNGTGFGGSLASLLKNFFSNGSTTDLLTNGGLASAGDALGNVVGSVGNGLDGFNAIGDGISTAPIVDWGSGGDYSDLFGFADGGLVEPEKLKLGAEKKSNSVNTAALLSLLDEGGAAGLNSLFTNLTKNNTGSGMSTLPTPINNDSSGASSTASSTAPSSPTGQSVAVGNAVGKTVAALVSMVAAPTGLVSLVNGITSATGHGKAIPTLSSVVSDLVNSINSSSSSGGVSSAAPGASVSVDGAAPVGIGIADGTPDSDAAVDAAVSAAADGSGVGSDGGDNGSASGVGAGGDGSGGPGGAGTGGDGAGNGGADGGSGGGAGGTGWADGGDIPRTNEDPLGIADNIHIKVSGGEYVMPKDVVDMIGVPFLDSIKNMFHTPAEEQYEPPGYEEDESKEKS